MLHRQLKEIGIENFVVRPRNWDEYGSSVKTDARDARELCCHLDRYLAGNVKALCVVRVPSLEEERRRALSRQRETLSKGTGYKIGHHTANRSRRRACS